MALTLLAPAVLAASDGRLRVLLEAPVKGLACSECITLRTLSHQGDLKPVSCDCGNVTGWWLVGRIGSARYTAERPAYAWGVGFNNHFLTPALGEAMHAGTTHGKSDAEWRTLHDRATDAPGFYFDKSKRDCWVVFFKPGQARDVEWATNEERAAVGLRPYPAGHALGPREEGR